MAELVERREFSESVNNHNWQLMYNFLATMFILCLKSQSKSPWSIQEDRVREMLPYDTIRAMKGGVIQW